MLPTKQYRRIIKKAKKHLACIFQKKNTITAAKKELQPAEVSRPIEDHVKAKISLSLSRKNNKMISTY